MFVLTVLCTVLRAAATPDDTYNYTAQALKDEITDLPGLPDSYTAKQFSGYIDITNGSIFYWLVEAQKNPASAPLIWWSNGGPGCSGMNGFLEENGPFRPQKDGTLGINDYSWNQEINMVFVEQPVGVGFSTAVSGIQYGDSQAAKDNREFLEGFLKVYPQYKGRDTYLSSESYGGHYLPTLALELVQNPVDSLNFKGFAVGNPLTYMPNRDYGMYFTYWGHQLLPQPLWDSVDAFDCLGNGTSPLCDSLLSQINLITRDLDPYALDFPTCVTAAKVGRRERFLMKRQIEKLSRRKRNQLGDYFPKTYQPCEDEYTSTYLNRRDVQNALHVRRYTSNWEVCSDAVNMGWPADDLNADVSPIYDTLIKAGLKLMIYSGDDDAVCATAGTQRFIWDMGWSHNPIGYWKEWKTDGVVAGYYTTFDNGFTFKTVHGAGHMVPSTRPEQSLNLINDFVN